MSKNSENSTDQTAQKAATGTPSESAKSSESKTSYALIEVEHTPFSIFNTPKGYIIATAGVCVSPMNFKTPDEAIEYLKRQNVDWEMLGATIVAIAKKINEIENRKEN